jgi:glucose-1-phosphate thymidylyltransferase
MISRNVSGSVDDRSFIVGDVVIEAGATVSDSTVRGPAIIGAGAVLENAYVGPFTAIGERCLLSNCEVEHSIVLSDSIIRNIDERISDSLIGKEVVVEKTNLKPQGVRLMLGDHAHVGF